MPAPKGNKNAAGNRGGGRPTKYKPEYAEMAFRIALIGATDEELAAIFGVSETTLNAWKKEHVEFSEALKEGKAPADGKVAASLYHRALGYSHDAVKIAVDANTGAEAVVPYTKHYPPDTTACIFWLKNRQSDHWRDKQDLEHSGSIEHPVLEVVTRDPGSDPDDAS